MKVFIRIKYRVAELLAADVADPARKAALDTAYEAFLPVNGAFKRLCTDWQVRSDTGEPNDHTDRAYDDGVVARLGEVHDRITVVLKDLATALGRFDAYIRRLENALERIRGGDVAAFARPLADALTREPDRWALDHLLVVLSGGAVLSPAVRDELLGHLPWAVVVDGYGTSETGGQGQMPVWPGQSSATLPRFHVDEHTAVLDDAGRPAPPGSGLVGRLARRGRIPLHYHGDPERSAETFTVLHGQRWAVPGDLARVEADGSITLLGRGTSSINTGGEKVFPGEVEITLKAHPSVFDAVVVGVPDPRFGEIVAAVVAPRAGHHVMAGELDRHCRQHLASFKVPRRLVVVDEVRYRPTGKADLVWARDQLLAERTAAPLAAPPAGTSPGGRVS